KTDQDFLATQPDGIYAKIETSKGDIYTLLEFKTVPMTVANYVGLAEGTIPNTFKPAGTPYFDGLIFHRVIPGFMIQGGCPQKNGGGSPGYKFADEFIPGSVLATTGYERGVLAMANAGPNTNGSQFFIMHKKYALPYSYTIFGHAVKGIEAVDSICAIPRDKSDRPSVEVTIKHIEILRKGKEAEDFDAAKVFVEQQALIVKAAEDKIQNMMGPYKDAKVTPSGLRYIVVQEGTGAAPGGPTANVTVHYTGTLLADGKKFDSSVDRGQPASFGLNQVIKGWTEGLQLMKEGGKIKLIIPPDLGYGPQGRPPQIPGNSWLVFDVELIKVN
ncbi:MAG: peptidylprolyl isomerase, partial [Bacteroidia bacterium]|nr:peptidylprolyl isomerase [Bacteroidia bacterium]